MADCVGKRWDTPLRRATAEWNRSNFIDLRIVGCDRPHQIKVRVVSVKETWAARTSSSYDPVTMHLTRARILLNNARTHGKDRGVLCHELGHTIGLNHRSETGSCMHTPITSWRPDAHDYRAIRRAYSHTP